MKGSLLTLFMAVITLAFVSGVMAQESATPAAPSTSPAPSTSAAPATSAPAAPAPMQESKAETFHGIITKVDESNKDFMVQYHKDKMSFALAENAKIMEGKKGLSFSDLKKGLWASIQYKKEGEKMVASMVRVSQPMMPEKKEGMSEKKETPSEQPATPSSTPSTSPSSTPSTENK